MHYRIKLLLLFVIVTFAACKKDSLNDDDMGGSNTPINIPAKAINDPAGNGKDTTNKVIVIIGSSTAAGFGASTADSSWAGRLKTRLIKDKKKVKVINLGIGGYTTYQLMPTGQSSTVERRPKPDSNANVTAALKYQPDLVIINLPSNDIAANFRDEEILKNYHIIARLIASARCSYIITGTQPRNFSTLAQRTRLKILNDKLVADFQDNVDNYLKKLSTATFSIQKIYSAGDGIHLNNRGHNAVYQSIVALPVFKTVAGY